MKKSFILVGTVINVLAIAAFIYVGCGMLEPHRFEDGVRLAIPAILVIMVGWVVSAVSWAKQSDRAIDVIGVAYVIAAVATSLNAGSLMGDAFSMFIWALLILGIAYAAIWGTLLFIMKKSR